jgi:hypothetical protein
MEAGVLHLEEEGVTDLEMSVHRRGKTISCLGYGRDRSLRPLKEWVFIPGKS